MPNDTPDLRRIINVVRYAGQNGCTVAYLVHITGGTEQAITKALNLQVTAGIMSSKEVFDGEKYLFTVYRMREGV
jgi:hypothetical protein